MNRRVEGKVAQRFVLALALAALPTVSAKATTWTNVSADGVVTHYWHTNSNWSAGVPVGSVHAFLTNTVNSYVVEVGAVVSTYTNATLLVSSSGGNTVTLNVNEDMTGGVGTGSGTDVTRFTLDARGNSVVNVSAGKSLRFNTPNTTSARMLGAINIYGTVHWQTLVTGSSYQTQLTIYDGGKLYTPQGTGQHGFSFGNLARIDIRPGGLWQHSNRQMQINVAAGSSLDIGGTFDFMPRRDFSVGSNNGTTESLVRVLAGGLFLMSDTATGNFDDFSLRIPNSTTVGARGRMLVDGGTVTNLAPATIGGHWQGNQNNAANTEGVVVLTGNGRWVNLGTVLVGGIVRLHSNATEENAANYNKVFGTLTQSNGYFRAASTLYVAEGASQGTVTVLGGDFHVTNVSATATMHVGSMVTSVTTMPGKGTLRIAGGHVVADRLFAVNGEGYSTFLYESGALSLRESTLDLGIPLTVGDGVQPAVLNLLGGTHSSAYGYVINTNATLSVGGTGAISSAAVTGDVTLRENARLAFKFNAGGQDALAVTGTVTLPESATLELTSLDGSTPNYIPLLTATGGFTGSNPSAWDRVTVGSVTYGVIIEGNNTLVAMPPKKGTMILLR